MEMDEVQLVELKASSFNYVRNIRSELLNTQIRKNRHYAPIEFEWYYGPTGTGKSRKAFEEGATPIQYANGFFTDWAGSKVLVYEEFRGQVPYHLMLQLTDAYHGYYSLNIKGGFRVLDIDKLIVTSPLRPEHCYPRQCEKKDSIQQLMRRITKLVFFNELGEQREESTHDIELAVDFDVQNGLWKHPIDD
nr:MAG: rep protein [Cressdnaviricota sp.]